MRIGDSDDFLVIGMDDLGSGWRSVRLEAFASSSRARFSASHDSLSDRGTEDLGRFEGEVHVDGEFANAMCREFGLLLR